MVATLDPETVKTRATHLTEAAATIKEIGDALKKHKVKGWEGEAATAFEDWTSRAGNATLRLSEYSAAGGKWMGEAAQIMVEVKKNMPSYDTAMAENLAAAKQFHNDPDSAKLAQIASVKLNSDHQKAVDALTKLAGSYDQSSTQMGKVEVPTFPPPPGDFVPVNVDGGQDVSRSGGSYGGASGSGNSSYAASTQRSGGPSNEPGWVPGHQPDPTPPVTTGPAPVPVIPDHDVDVDLDHVATLPEKTVPPVVSLPTGPGPVPGGPTPVGPLPTMTFPPMSGPSLPGGGGPISKLPPLAPPGGKTGGLSPLLPRDTGIVGGRQVTTGGPTPGIPRGNVIGHEGGSQPGRGMASGMHPGGGSGPHGGQSGSAMGRRLAMEPGGVVGGRQPGAVGRSVAGGQPFTQGGSGLVRNGSGTGPARGGTGPAGAGTHTPAGRREQRGGERPDYLAEDEETWQGNDRVVPPVID
ncbi:hypothetical protein AB0B01_29260 [Streptomyces sp. NPDC044571]|uniref:WXG100 family type VII secretion target n=1 Tax=Streptomyces sp. NPDC044571 TaxID=3155371 RepID=UPI0033CEFC1A